MKNIRGRKFHACAERVSIPFRDRERAERKIDGHNIEIVTFEFQRHRDAAAAGADVDDARATRRNLQHFLNEQLRLRARNQHAGVDVKLAAVKVCASANVLQRLAGDSSRHQHVDREIVNRLITVRDEPRGWLAEEIGEKQIDVAPMLAIAVAD